MKNILTIALLLSANFLTAQITVEVNANFQHIIDTFDTFERERYIQVHADNTEPDWSGANFANFTNLRDSFLNTYDVYMGRNTGGISFHFSEVEEDPNRPGYADPADIADRGQNTRNSYANNTAIHPYEARNNQIIATQQRPFFPNGTLTNQGWAPANGDAVGEFMGRFVNEFFGQNGEPAPKYIEVMNEPLYELLMDGHTPTEIFQFHNEVADAIRAQDVEIPIGGYVAAFPDFEKRNFDRWHERMKLFMDMSGDKMDYWAIHLYDFNMQSGGNFKIRRGSNMEATFDMMEHYSELSFNEVKPFLISEFGGRALNLESQAWTPFRDWQTLKSLSSMMLTFGERPDQILSAIPFIPIKAEWGSQDNGSPYPWRLMRRRNEMPGETGNQWVFTEMVKFYQLWSDVNGFRVDAESTNPDIQTSAFVEGDKMYVILNNLLFEEATVNLNIIENNGNAIQNARVKHLYLDADNVPALDEATFSSLDEVSIGAEGTIIIEYTFAENVALQEVVEEEKYYADVYLTEIIPFAKHEFNLNGINKSEQGEALLRLGMGRSHGLILQPIITFNGHEIEVPENYEGYDQLSRDSWFGVIEIPVPYAYLQAENKVTVQYPDAGGYISSMTMRVFNQSAPIVRADAVSVAAIALNPAFKQLEPTQEYALTATISPINATNHTIVWTSSDETVATVDESGKVTALVLGETTITATTVDGNLTASSTIEVVLEAMPVVATNLEITPATFEMPVLNQLQLQAAFSPIDATDQTVNWTTSDPNIGTVDANGLFTAGVQEGVVEVTGTNSDGTLSDVSSITVIVEFDNWIQCTFLPSQIDGNSEFDINIDYSAGYPLDAAIELEDTDGDWICRGQTTVNPGIGTATVTLECVSTVDFTTPILPDPGMGYTLEGSLRQVGGDETTNVDSCTKGNITINEPLGIVPVELASFKLFPNPTQNQLYIALPDLKNTATLTVFDVFGKAVLQQNIQQLDSQISLSPFASGMYLVKIETKEGSVVKRIIKE